MNAALLTTWSLAWREVIRFLRQRSRVIGMLVQMLIFWLMFGFGLGASFQPQNAPEGLTYLEYYFPGIIALIVLFTAIFSSISTIEDRNEGFLQSVLVAPVPPLSIVLGKVLGVAALAGLHALLFALLAPLSGLSLSGFALVSTLGAALIMAIGLGSIAFVFAWKIDSVGGFHAVMMGLLFPMWILSGAFFPAEGLPIWFEWIMKLNPLTYGVAAIRHSFYQVPIDLGMPTAGVAFGVSIAFALLMLIWAPTVLRRKVPSA